MGKIFGSLKWFKSEKEKELEELVVEQHKLRIEEQKLVIEEQKNKNALLTKELAQDWTPFVTPDSGKPYKKLKLVDSVLTIVLKDGSLINKPGATEKDFSKARACITEDDLINLTTSPEAIREMKVQEAKVEQARAIISGMEKLRSHSDFEVVNNSVYMRGIKRSIPAMLVERFAELAGSAYSIEGKEDYEALKKFWLKCCLNPNAKSAEDLYVFLANHQFKIDKHGNFYAYRRVKSLGAEKGLIDFIGNAYSKVKAVWKKRPADFTVYQNDEQEYGITSNVSSYAFQEENNTVIGNLEELYLDLPNMADNRYTSAHTGQEDYRVGEVISMPRHNGDDNNQVSCSKGFHAASKAYDYSGFGDTPILVIINPMDVLAVPHGEVGKLRTCRWFFATTLDRSEQHILDDEDFDVLDLGDVFEEKCLDNLQAYVGNSFAEEVQRHTFTIPSITGLEIQRICTSLEEMKDALSRRVHMF